MAQYLGLGATYLGNGRCGFLVWAPLVQNLQVHIVAPRERSVVMRRAGRGYHRAVLDGVPLGTRYFYKLEGLRDRPDPASRAQPEGVAGPSQVVDPNSFRWQDQGWAGIPLAKYIIYELHVGTFTPEGTFRAIIPHLANLRALGITAIELMPVAQFPGARNWGYDGVLPFATQDSYGGLEGLQYLVDACHREGLAVILDVVYNHIGPEGNYLGEFGHYFTDRYRTPWGAAINFDGPHSDEVRRFFSENTLFWLSEAHIDALRLDSVHAIKDFSAQPFLQELAETVRRRSEQLGRPLHLIAESDLNDARVIRPRELGGLGLDAQWNDDFHHSLHVLLTGERSGYYQDFGTVSNLARALREGFVYSGQYSLYRRRRHGNSSLLNKAQQFVVCAQNHDQIGNRMLGERLGDIATLDCLKLAAGVVLLSPYLPLVFMGEEYGETAPFQYFTSHSDPALIAAVRKGRREEFKAFDWMGEAPDPQDEATFLRSKLHHDLLHVGKHRVLWAFYQELMRLRTTLPPLSNLSKSDMRVVCFENARALTVRRWTDDQQVLIALNFGDAPARLALPSGRWQKELDSAESRWLGSADSDPATLLRLDDSGLLLSAKNFAVLSASR